MVLVPPRSSNEGLHTMLQAAVQTVEWTYSLFWQLCPQQGILVWSDGYYNGAIKTRKTVQPTEMSTEEASLQRSQQLKQLFESLSSGETNHQTRRPSTALSPEDLSETEWFYLMCISFSFPPEVGLPGRAHARGQHLWLSGANEVERKVFSRAILAKSAKIQTVVCIPLLDGVVELGTTERVKEDSKLIHRIKSFFIDVEINTSPPKPALSEHSTSNHPTSFDNIPVMLPTCALADPAPIHNSHVTVELPEQDEAAADSDSEEGGRDENMETVGGTTPATRELSELMQLDYISEAIRVGSPDDGSNNMDHNIHLLAVSRMTDSAEHHRRIDMSGAELIHSLQQSQYGFPSFNVLTKEDTRYSETVSTILQNQPGQWSNSSFPTISSAFIKYSATSPAFSHHLLLDGASQWTLKYMLFTVPFLNSKSTNANSTAGFSRSTTQQEELSANHVLAERRRREKINDRFIILRSLVPCVTKMDKASILGDTIEYVKQLHKKIQELETRAGQMEAENNNNDIIKEQNSENTSGKGERKQMIYMEGNGGSCGSGGQSKGVESLPQEAGEEVQVEVSIIESDALIEIQRWYKEGLLLDVMQVLRTLRIEVTTAQSSIINGVFAAEFRAKVNENVSGKKASIMEVKRAINQIILQ